MYKSIEILKVEEYNPASQGLEVSTRHFGSVNERELFLRKWFEGQAFHEFKTNEIREAITELDKHRTWDEPVKVDYSHCVLNLETEDAVDIVVYYSSGGVKEFERKSPKSKSYSYNENGLLFDVNFT